MFSHEDRQLVIDALLRQAGDLRRKAAGRKWAGSQFIDTRARLRSKAARCEQLAREIRAGRQLAA